MTIIDNFDKLCKIVTYQGFNEILSQHGALEKALNGGQTWFDIGYDDLDFVETIMDMEIKFNITIDDDFSNTLLNMKFSDFYDEINLIKIRNDKLNQLGI